MTVNEALALAIEHHRAGRLAEAAELYRRILEVDSNHFNALQLSGQVALHQGDHQAAISLLRRAVAIHPDFIPAQAALAEASVAAGQGPQAVARYRLILTLQPEAAAFWRRLGKTAADCGSAMGHVAVAGLRRALVLEPQDAATRYNLGLTLRGMERLAEATAEYRAAVGLQPDFAAVHMSLGNALLEEGDCAAALRSLQRAAALLPSAPEIFFNLGNVLHTMGDFPVALQAYRRAADLGLAAGQVRTGVVLRDLGRSQEAMAVLRAALNAPLRGADAPTAIENLTALMIDAGRLDEGRAFFTRLADQPLGGVKYIGECLTALADIDLCDGKAKEAAARLAQVSGDNCRFFTVKSLAALAATMQDMGATLIRPVNPDPSRPRITSSSLGTHGRFAHNALEYVLLRLYAEKYGLTLETPDWVGGWFFDLDDPRPAGPLRPLNFARRSLNALVQGDGDRAPLVDCDILSPLFLFEHKEIWRDRVQGLLKPRPMWRPFLDPAMQRLRELGDTVVAVHIRRGDFVQYGYPITETRWYVDWLREIWPTLRRPTLYVASDDLAGVCDDFAEFSPRTRGDVAPDWPGLEYLQDFHVLMHADVVGISTASGYSTLAARLNVNARMFVEPDAAARKVRPFVPWTP
jgi:tetratricopeptide (TPR) repeat protein